VSYCQRWLKALGRLVKVISQICFCARILRLDVAKCPLMNPAFETRIANASVDQVQFGMDRRSELPLGSATMHC
jgi:hypothetical protein